MGKTFATVKPDIDEKVWCCRTSGDGRKEAYKYGLPVTRCTDCTICKSAKDYPKDPRQNIQILRGYR